MVYVLTKLSSPGWELATSHIEQIVNQFDPYVCGMCRTPKPEDSDNDINEETYCDYFPANYKVLSPENKIDILLGTACGCEFMFEKFESWDDYYKNMVSSNE